MAEKEVKIQLFLVEGEVNFEKMSLREKMTLTIRKGDGGIQEWFFGLGADEKLPKQWPGFKEAVLKYCSAQDIEAVRKFQDEEWHEYVTRLVEWAIAHESTEEDIWAKLRTLKAPEKYQVLFYSGHLTFEELSSRLMEWQRIEVATMVDQAGPRMKKVLGNVGRILKERASVYLGASNVWSRDTKELTAQSCPVSAGASYLMRVGLERWTRMRFK